ncbi:MAG: class I SAM-dependent methyltransferase [Acidobacteria bacterium]|nr:class I SAM-dependent methyltransferase [Acidobacteriota bacterium]
MNLEAYGEFAWVYDAALGEPFAQAARSTLERVITGYLGDVRGPALDLACGSGLSTRMLTELGFRAVGLDASLSMLSIASSRAERLVAGDIRKIPLRGPYPLVTCLYDSLNHMLTVPDLHGAMMEVAAILAADGIFVFDMNQPEVYSALWDAEEPFRHRDGSRSLTMKTSFDAASAIATAEIRGSIEAAEGEAFIFLETRRQRAWDFEEIADAVMSAGLRIDVRVDFDPFGQSGDSGLGVKWLLAATHG